MGIKRGEFDVHDVEIHEKSRTVKQGKRKMAQQDIEKHRTSNREWMRRTYGDEKKREKLLKYQAEWRKKNRDKVNGYRKKDGRDQREEAGERGVGGGKGGGGGSSPAANPGQGVAGIWRSIRIIVSHGPTSRTDEDET